MGQKKPFTIEEARRLKDLLRAAGRCRDLALASVAFDSALRCCDVLALRWDQILDASGSAKGRVTIRQRKTRANVTFELSADTRASLEDLAVRTGGTGYVFAGGTPEVPLSGRQYRCLVKKWAGLLELPAEDYSTHSLRRTKPAAVYRRTRDPEIARILLGQRSLMATHRYLGLGQEEALAKAREVEI
ncbi:MAG TPA: tyrosine-type recombinase/integrase [Roseibacillus sp.]|nr:tyrosine-type recombinase/integrase [Roseibacillus sp.]